MNERTPMSDASSAALDTYRLVRAVVLLAVVLLTISLAIELVRAGDCSPMDSISAYYYSPVRPIFIGALVSIGICLVVLEGHSRVEDILLNLAGFFAPVVALVPKKGAGQCVPDDDQIAAVKVVGLRPDGTEITVVADWVVHNVENNAWAYVGALGVGCLAMSLYGWTQRGPGKRYAKGTWMRERLIAAVGSALIVATAGATLALTWGEQETKAHFITAIAMFGCLAIAALDNGLRSEAVLGRGTNPKHLIRLRVAYRWIFFLMVAAGFVLLSSWENDVFYVEVVEIGLFSAFWVMQTWERWSEQGSFGGRDLPAWRWRNLASDWNPFRLITGNPDYVDAATERT